MTTKRKTKPRAPGIRPEEDKAKGPAPRMKKGTQVFANGTSAMNAIPSVRTRNEDEIVADWKWVLLEAGAAALEPYSGQHIAVVGKKIISSGPRSLPLRTSAASKLGLDPESVVIYLVG